MMIFITHIGRGFKDDIATCLSLFANDHQSVGADDGEGVGRGVGATVG